MSYQLAHIKGITQRLGLDDILEVHSQPAADVRDVFRDLGPAQPFQRKLLVIEVAPERWQQVAQRMVRSEIEFGVAVRADERAYPPSASRHGLYGGCQSPS